MREREKGEIVIDICPQCRGVWLDAGELERLGERESRYYDDDDDDDWEKRGWQDRDPRREGQRVQEYRGHGRQQPAVPAAAPEEEGLSQRPDGELRRRRRRRLGSRIRGS